MNAILDAFVWPKGEARAGGRRSKERNRGEGSVTVTVSKGTNIVTTCSLSLARLPANSHSHESGAPAPREWLIGLAVHRTMRNMHVLVYLKVHVCVCVSVFLLFGTDKGESNPPLTCPLYSLPSWDSATAFGFLCVADAVLNVGYTQRPQITYTHTNGHTDTPTQMHICNIF